MPDIGQIVSLGEVLPGPHIIDEPWLGNNPVSPTMASIKLNRSSTIRLTFIIDVDALIEVTLNDNWGGLNGALPCTGRALITYDILCRENDRFNIRSHNIDVNVLMCRIDEHGNP